MQTEHRATPKAEPTHLKDQWDAGHPCFEGVVADGPFEALCNYVSEAEG